MSFWSRVKSFVGGNWPIRTLASAATLNVPDDDNVYYVSGSTTVTALVSASQIRNRKVTFIGAASASVVFTNTTGTSTVNQMDLGGTNLTLAAKDVLELFCREDGSWLLLNFAQNNATTITLASATADLAIPNTGDIFILTGSTSLTTFVVTNPGEPRRVTFIGGTSAAVPLVNTNSPSAGQMYLHGTNLLLMEQDVITFIMQTDGSLLIESTTIA